MKTNPHSTTRSLVLAALFLALAFVLPMITGHVPQIGNMLCPMHFPVLLAGFVLGGPWGLALGFAAPLLRSVLFGMPPMYPIAIAMAFELATYGAVAGFMYRKVQHTLPMIYAALVTSMVAGRLVWGAVRFVLAGLSGSAVIGHALGDSQVSVHHSVVQNSSVLAVSYTHLTLPTNSRV